MQQSIEPLLTRRSTSVRDLAAPAPDAGQLELILRAATRVPDHGKLCPWRIVVLQGEGALKLGAIAADQFLATHGEAASPAQLEATRKTFARAPLVLAVLSTPVLGTKPVWEQELSAGAVCMNILHAAHMLGFGAKWLTEWVAYDAKILEALLNPSPLAGEARWGGGAESNGAGFPAPSPQPSPARGEGAPRVAGFIYLGTKMAETEDRARPKLEEVVREY